jgi:hypothetical protein
METKNKTALDIVQELIAIHTTRKEVIDKLSVKQGSEENQSVIVAAKQQSDHFITELLTELSTFGDAVQDSIDRDNEYQLTWKNEFKNFNAVSLHEAMGIFEKLENALKIIYDSVLETKELPDSLVQILSAQRDQIKK